MLNFDYVSVCVDRNDKIAAFALAFPRLPKPSKVKRQALSAGFLRILHAMSIPIRWSWRLSPCAPIYRVGFNAVVCNGAAKRREKRRQARRDRAYAGDQR